MSHNAVIRGGTGSGSWTGVVVTTTDMETFDQRQFESINGDLGGVWAPASAITIGGAGLNVTGSVFTVSAGIFSSTSGLLISGGNLQVAGGGTASFSGNVSIDGQLNITGTAAIVTFTGSSLLVGAGTTFASNALLTLTAGLTISSGAVTIAGASAFSANASFAGSSFIVTSPTILFGTSTSTISLVGPVVLSQLGHIVPRVVTAATPPGSFLDSNTTISVGTSGSGIMTGDIFQPGTLTANRIWTVVSTGIADGCTFDVSLIDCPPGFFAQLHREDATTIVTLTNAVGQNYAARFVKRGGAWAVHSLTKQ